MKIRWDKKFEVGHERIDFEHRIFLDLVNAFHDRLSAHAPRDALARILLEISKYAEFHFVSEENIMADVAYPELTAHATLHADLLKQLNQWIAELRSGKMDGLEPIQFFEFLVNWFAHHTAQEDKKIADFLLGKKSLATLGGMQ